MGGADVQTNGCATLASSQNVAGQLTIDPKQGSPSGPNSFMDKISPTEICHLIRQLPLLHRAQFKFSTLQNARREYAV
jgi:hypothetical protein